MVEPARGRDGRVREELAKGVVHEMTWVIGASSIFDYGAMMSDVRVTFSDGRQHELVQKAYAVGCVYRKTSSVLIR
jgi:hypothetical protein